MDDAWLKLVVDQEDADGRFATPEAKAANDKGRKFFADMHRKDLHDDAAVDGKTGLSQRR